MISIRDHDRIRVKIGTKPIEIAKLRPPSYRVIPYQAFKAAGFEQTLPRSGIKGRLRDNGFQLIYTLTLTVGTSRRTKHLSSNRLCLMRYEIRSKIGKNLLHTEKVY